MYPCVFSYFTRGFPLLLKRSSQSAPSIIFFALVGLTLYSLLWIEHVAAQTGSKSDVSAATALARASLPRGSVRDFGAAPSVPDGPLNEQLTEAVGTVFIDGILIGWGSDQDEALDVIADSKDPRLAWIITDLLRFAPGRSISQPLTEALEQLLKVEFNNFSSWHDATNRLIAWDIPAPPNYLTYKRSIFTSVLPEWEPIFVEGDIDWRIVSWGGVRIDDRAFDNTDDPCNCIPAADNPAVTDAKSATWLKNDDVVFGIVLNGEARAYPRQIMEVREMVNDTLGGRDLGIPYCTLCGSAQAWFTDRVPDGVERPILRTSGLLSRSNKVMFDLNTYSVFDTFRGNAVTGPLAKKGVELSQASVVTTTWGEWKKAYPETTVLEERLALGRNFDFRNGRDADGPIFPIGDVDPRLPVQEDILGTVTASGTPVAFHVDSLIKVLDAGEKVEVENIEIVMDARGVRAIDKKGEDLGTHQSFWFAWSQFYPETLLWPEI